MHARHGWLAVALAAILLWSSVQAREDRWFKHHREIRFDGVRQAEYTSISNLGEPGVTKLLYRDAAGENIVIRRLTEKGVRSVTSIELVRTGEKLTAEARGEEVTVTLGDRSFTFRDVEGQEKKTRASGGRLIATASPEFQRVLRRLAVVGSKAIVIHDCGYLLSAAVYGDIPLMPPDPHEEGKTESVIDFDPVRHPPGAFEKAFGNAYYE